MIPQPRLRVLVFEPLRSYWIARVLEHDIAVEDRTLDGALRSLLDIVLAHIAFDRRHGRPPLSAFSSAPDRYWRAFESATPMRTLNLRAGCSEGEGTMRIAVAGEDSSQSLLRPRAVPAHPRMC